jgi:hypothetical protein
VADVAAVAAAEAVEATNFVAGDCGVMDGEGITPRAAKTVRQISNGYVEIVAHSPAPAPARNATAVGFVLIEDGTRGSWNCCVSGFIVVVWSELMLLYFMELA